MPENWHAVGDAVSKGMKELGVTQQELAKLACVSPMTIRKMVNSPGRSRPSEPILRAISWELGWSPRYLESIRDGYPLPEVAAQAADDTTLQFLRKIMMILQRRMGGVVDIIYNDESRLNITIEIKHSPQD